ncbi:MAG: hypothetical protein RLZZ09_2502 [Pseudomonadota bacterium]
MAENQSKSVKFSEIHFSLSTQAVTSVGSYILQQTPASRRYLNFSGFSSSLRFCKVGFLLRNSLYLIVQQNAIAIDQPDQAFKQAGGRQQF